MVKYCMLETRAATTPKCGGARSYLQWWPNTQHCIRRCHVSTYFYMLLYVFTPPSAAAAHCGRAFRMAFTSSATAVSANSNWSWDEWTGRASGQEEDIWILAEIPLLSLIEHYLGTDQAGSLVPDVLQWGCDVDLLHSWQIRKMTDCFLVHVK